MVKAALEGGWLPLLHSVTKNDAKNDNRDQKSEPPPLHVPDRVRRILERTKLTDGYLTAVSARLFNSTRSKRFMRAATLQGFDIVLDIKGMQALPATEAGVSAAIQLMLNDSQSVDFEILSFLLEEHGDNLPISEEVVFAAAAIDERSGYEHRNCQRLHAFKLLLDHRGLRLPVSDRAVEALIMQCCYPVVKLLLQKRTWEQLRITEKAVISVVSNDYPESINMWNILVDGKI